MSAKLETLGTALINNVPQLRVGMFRFVLRAEAEVRLPGYKGSTLRGAFGMALKRAVCVRKDMNCDICLVRPSCTYTYLFETPPPEGAASLGGQKHAPRPFVLDPPLERRQQCVAGESLTFDLTLFGRAIDYLPYVIFAIDRAGQKGLGRERGRFALESVSWRVSEGEWRLIYDGAGKCLSSGPFSQSVEEFISQRCCLFGAVNFERAILRLGFLTPTRIRVGGDLQAEVTFELLVRNILRRLWQVASLHCGVELSIDYQRLIERARGVSAVSSELKWQDWKRFSRRQGTRMRMGGFVGEVEFTSPDPEFLPLLALGEMLHIGTGTTMGLGKFEISFVRHPRSYQVRGEQALESFWAQRALQSGGEV